jgi:glycosyltransferase involved in cell wall biosynthesis
LSAAGAAERPLRILVVNWQDRENPQSGGAEIHLHETFGRIARGGDEVTLLCSGFAGGSSRTTLDGIDVHRTAGRHSFLFKARRYFDAHLKRRAFDVIVEDLNKVPLFTQRWSESPVVLLVHHLFGATAFQEASFPVAALTWILERPVPKAYRHTRVIAISESTKQDLIERGFAAEQIQVVHNGVDVDALTPGSEEARFATPTVLYLGRLKRYKGVDLVIRAIALLRDRGHPAELVVAGGGDYRPELEALVDRLKLGARVRFAGIVSESEKRDLFRGAWLHAIASPKEGWGIANLEAAACGTPTVASDSPGLRDSVIDGKTGVLAPHGDVPAFAAALQSLLDDRARRREMGRAARAFAETASWDASARRVREVLSAAARGAVGGGVSPGSVPTRAGRMTG